MGDQDIVQFRKGYQRSPLQNHSPSHVNVFPSLDNSDRDLQARARRLERFKDDINLAFPNGEENGTANQKGKKFNRMTQKTDGEQSGGVRSQLFPYEEEMGNHLDHIDAIVGLCPDMCPEQEREERQRKGHLDQYERLNGDRYQTTEFLAVKKYNRTAEREAVLIRPMHVLHKTMDYLLLLLDQSYDDASFINIYNFMWDRMRAIRMDLRMQHIFNMDAVSMLEKMIRLHIIAMHEFCEYERGEGFTEGFDAHLNIEQMNKASVELFQMYDDHRKHGIKIPTEAEFRGYYALLKLDKHRGYKVGSADLLHDLAHMSADVRQAPEILFAREVARDCRVGNVVGFFRLASKATYLQACLMHAHFVKMRTQGLVFIHSSLRKTQGMLLSTVGKWLAMEDEGEVRGLLELHGFIVKEQHMLRDGGFLCGDEEYPTRCSRLVERKRSLKIADDVAGLRRAISPELLSSCDEETRNVDEEMSEVEFLPVVFEKGNIPSIAVEAEPEEDDSLSFVSPSVEASPLISSPATVVVLPPPLPVVVLPPPLPVAAQMVREEELPAESEEDVEPDSCFSAVSKLHSVKLPGILVDSSLNNLNSLENHSPPEYALDPDAVQKCRVDAGISKLKFIIRRWKRYAVYKRESRAARKRQRRYDALAAMSVGIPLKMVKYAERVQPEMSLDRMMTEMKRKNERVWSTLNVSEAVVDALSRKNPGMDLLHYNLVLCCSPSVSADPSLSLLRAKLMPDGTRHADIIESSPGLTVWRTSRPPGLTCLSAVRDSLTESANGILFLFVSGDDRASQKSRLRALSRSAPDVPLLVLISGPTTELGGIHTHVLDLDADPDVQLRSSLDWLAAQSPPQPRVRRVTALDLVSTHADFETTITAATPDDIVSAFNRSLERSSEAITKAVRSNVHNFPSPDTAAAAFCSVPPPGWSSDSNTRLALSAVARCALPNMSDVSWLDVAVRSPDQLDARKLELESFLAGYVRRCFGTASDRGILRARVALRGVSYLLVPDWRRIFRAITASLLVSRLHGIHVYVLSEDHRPPRGTLIGPPSVFEPSLDEMVRAARSSDCLLTRLPPLPSPSEESAPDSYTCSPDAIATSAPEDEARRDGFSQLIGRCTIMQDRIAESLRAAARQMDALAVMMTTVRPSPALSPPPPPPSPPSRPSPQGFRVPVSTGIREVTDRLNALRGMRLDRVVASASKPIH